MLKSFISNPILFCTFLCLIGGNCLSQQLWNRLNNQNLQIKPVISAEKNCSYKVDIEALKDLLNEADNKGEVNISFPLMNGKQEQFKVQVSGVMAPELRSKFPEIRAYSGHGVEHPTHSIKLELYPTGLHVMIFTSDGITFLESFSDKSIDYVNCFSKSSFYKKAEKEIAKGERVDFVCEVSEDRHKLPTSEQLKSAATSFTSGTELRKYRIAITCNGEYAQYHGGTVNSVLAAMVTTMNRVNGVYEREIACTMEIIANNDLLLFFDPQTDPYSNNANLLEQIGPEINRIVGEDSYDLGHGFSTGAGGRAYLGVVCAVNKFGVTGSANPIGDPYDIDYVAHEIGHQFGGSHTFNSNAGSCSGNGSMGHNFEPGSGTTIQAYAGICGNHNIQSNSNDYFHVHSLEQMISHTTLGSGAQCPVITPTNNQAPEVDAGVSNLTIPKSTPFKLSASGSDPDGDSVYFCWEEYDSGPFGAPNAPAGDAAIFRSFPPTNSGTRYLPQLSDVLAGEQTLGEILPDYSRNLNFRCTVRDYNPNGGGVTYEEVHFEVDGDSGPFEVTNFNNGGSYFAGDMVTLNWDVANTNQLPVNCQAVNILLSTDGGLSFPIVMAAGVPNDGSQSLIIPNELTNNARIMLEAADNIFFNVNDAEFVIEAAVNPTFTMQVETNANVMFQEDTLTGQIHLTGLAGFNEEITLSSLSNPQHLDVQLAGNGLITNISVPFTIISDDQILTQNLTLVFEAVSNSVTHQDSVKLEIVGVNGMVHDGLIEPSDGETNVELRPQFTWHPALLNSSSYIIQVATDEQFNDIILEESELKDTFLTFNSLLESNTEYFWRIIAVHVSGAQKISEVHSFETINLSCTQVMSSEVPVAIGLIGNVNISSSLNLSAIEGEIYDLNVISLSGQHTYISDLTFTLTGPDGTAVVLIDQICSSENNFDLSMDDEAINSVIPCPPIGGASHVPQNPLSAFDDKDPNGTWVLDIFDAYDEDGGSLDSWGIEVCILGDPLTFVDELTDKSTQLIVFPNPSSNILSIQFMNDIYASGKVAFYNSSGQLIAIKVLEETGKNYLADISDLAKGLFLMKIETKVGYLTKSFVKN